MRMKLVISLLWLVSSPLGIAGQPKPRYTTLVVQYAGEQERYIFPVVISTLSEEGEWYRQQLWPKGGDALAFVQVVPQSVLDEITELPLLKSQLMRGDDEPQDADGRELYGRWWARPCADNCGRSEEHE